MLWVFLSLDPLFPAIYIFWKNKTKLISIFTWKPIEFFFLEYLSGILKSVVSSSYSDSHLDWHNLFLISLSIITQWHKLIYLIWICWNPILIPQEKDPFWEPHTTPVLIGTVSVFMQTIPYLIEMTDKLNIMDVKGQEVGGLANGEFWV